MKKSVCIFLTVLLCLSVFSAFAEDTKEYRDSIYSFLYPADWSLDVADNGDIVLLSPKRDNAILTYAIVLDLLIMSNEDAIITAIEQYDGKNLKLDGTYEPVQFGDFKGYRATGKWLTGGYDAILTAVACGRHMVFFVFVGSTAIGIEQQMIESVELMDRELTAEKEGYHNYSCAQFSIVYPEGYAMMDTGSGVAFINTASQDCFIMARAYALDFAYEDSFAPIIASQTLPTSTGITAAPVMTTICGRNAAMITGTTSDTPVSLYVIGSGRTALVIMFFSEEANSEIENVISSAEIF